MRVAYQILLDFPIRELVWNGLIANNASEWKLAWIQEGFIMEGRRMVRPIQQFPSTHSKDHTSVPSPSWPIISMGTSIDLANVQIVYSIASIGNMLRMETCSEWHSEHIIYSVCLCVHWVPNKLQQLGTVGSVGSEHNKLLPLTMTNCNYYSEVPT